MVRFKCERCGFTQIGSVPLLHIAAKKRPGRPVVQRLRWCPKGCDLDR